MMGEANRVETSGATGGGNCPVCECDGVTLLSPSWKRYHDEKAFFLSEKEWFVVCDDCGTVFRYPLLSYADYRRYGEDYYDNVNPGQSVEEHAVWHFESFQKPNYDSIYDYLKEHVPSSIAKTWLDVGSIGYATTFDEYEFTTIEPDQRIVELGRELFRKKGLKGFLAGKPRIYCHTIESFDDAASFDGILFNNSFYCLPFPIDGLKKAARLLSENGHLVITMSTYFCDAVAVRTDGMLSRIEDVLQGETLWVFYNSKSLEYLAQRAGFELVSATEIPAYGKKTMRAYHFRKRATFAPDASLLAESKRLMTAKMADLHADFVRQTRSSLVEFNKSDVYFVGTMPMLHDLSGVGALDKIAGFVPFDCIVAGGTPDGVRCVSWDDLQRAVESEPGRFSVVVASYKFQDEIFGRLSGLLQKLGSAYRPNRKSGMETLNMQFGGRLCPGKGVTFERLA